VQAVSVKSNLRYWAERRSRACPYVSTARKAAKRKAAQTAKYSFFISVSPFVLGRLFRENSTFAST
jgi:hypothetical protein